MNKISHNIYSLYLKVLRDNWKIRDLELHVDVYIVYLSCGPYSNEINIFL
jgi:hypothetical protein